VTARLSLSVCIATHQRPLLLAETLQALGAQDRAPDEILISDSSPGDASGKVIEAFRAQHSGIPTRWLRTPCSALPWLRHVAASRAWGEVVLFLDDDVTLVPEALGLLERAYQGLREGGGERVGGIGLKMVWRDGSSPERDARALPERWLGTAGATSGCITRGGLTVSMADLERDAPVPVDYLWGGAMSFPREVLQQVGLLDCLVILYEEGAGRGEDAVLSRCARLFGRLYVLTPPAALHRKVPPDEPTPYGASGWRLGITATWGRAHTLRWLAEKPAAYRLAWARLATLELARSIKAVCSKPWRSAAWGRLAGAGYGIGKAVLHWRRISPRPRSDMPRSWPVEEVREDPVLEAGAP
jgi:glycosyltransferase involved in cell wall biosynthesis